jgi:cobalt-zinc-cadmium efflux system protein
LALRSDAGDMRTVAGAIGLTLIALRLAARPARGALTFGLRRAEILSAQANGVTLLVLAGFIVFEGLRRLVDPPHVHATLVLVVAVVGMAVNVAAVRLLAGAGRGNLGIEGSFQHVLMDLYGFVGTAVAAIVILATGFQRADPLVSLLIAALMAKAGYGLVRASGRIFLEAAPEGVDPDAIGAALVAEPGVVEVHDLHVWEVASGFPALAAHVLVAQDSDCHDTRRALEQLLRERFAITHTTLQVDHAASRLIEIEPRRPRAAGPPGP